MCTENTKPTRTGSCTMHSMENKIGIRVVKESGYQRPLCMFTQRPEYPALRNTTTSTDWLNTRDPQLKNADNVDIALPKKITTEKDTWSFTIEQAGERKTRKSTDYPAILKIVDASDQTFLQRHQTKHRLNSAGMWNIFKLDWLEPEDANLPPYRPYPLSRIASGGGLALLDST